MKLTFSSLVVTAEFSRFAGILSAALKKDVHDPDNHDGVITHLEPDILECEVKWALGSITMNKSSGADGMEFELSYFKS